MFCSFLAINYSWVSFVCPIFTWFITVSCFLFLKFVNHLCIFLLISLRFLVLYFSIFRPVFVIKYFLFDLIFNVDMCIYFYSFYRLYLFLRCLLKLCLLFHFLVYRRDAKSIKKILFCFMYFQFIYKRYTAQKIIMSNW